MLLAYYVAEVAVDCDYLLHFRRMAKYRISEKVEFLIAIGIHIHCVVLE